MSIRELIYSGLTTSVTGTSKIYFDHFPDNYDNKNDKGLLFFLDTDPAPSFDAKSIVKNVNLNIVVRAHSLDVSESIRSEASTAIYDLDNTQYIAHVAAAEEQQTVYNDDLKTWDCFASFILFN